MLFGSFAWAATVTLGGLPDTAGRVVPTYVTLWQSQIRSWGVGPKWFEAAAEALGEFGHVVTSVNWDDIERVEGVFDMAPAVSIAKAICGAGLKAILVLDAWKPPAWVLAQHPDAHITGGGPLGHPCNSKSSGPSYAHPAVRALTLRFFERVAAAFPAGAGQQCVVALSPNLNNELEARYVQECDIFTDYNPHALHRYRSWLRAQNEDAKYWTSRWGSIPPNQRVDPAAGHVTKWNTIAPPRVWGESGAQPATSLAFWDWMRFREVENAGLLREACDGFYTSSGRTRGCFLHFGEVFSSIDAINGAQAR